MSKSESDPTNDFPYESAYPPPSSSSIALYTQVEIIVGAGLQTYEYLERTSLDKIFGTDGNDLIFGEKGEDYFLMRRAA